MLYIDKCVILNEGRYESHLHSNFHLINMCPKRNCLKKEFLDLKGTSFRKWVKDPSHLYIHKNLSKYLKQNNVDDSMWYKDISELQKFVNTNVEEVDITTAYERCIRETPELWNGLDNLENKVLGCWCKPSQPCHGDVLIKLFNEKKNDEVQDNMVLKNVNKKNMKNKRLIDMH